MPQLNEILDPGERLLAQEPVVGIPWHVRLLAAIWLVAFVAALWHGSTQLIVVVAAASGLVLLLDKLRPGGTRAPWRAALTDRRLLWRAGAGSDYQAAALADVEVAGVSPGLIEAGRITIRHRTQLFEFTAGRRATKRIRLAIRRAKVSAG